MVRGVCLKGRRCGLRIMCLGEGGAARRVARAARRTEVERRVVGGGRQHDGRLQRGRLLGSMLLGDDGLERVQLVSLRPLQPVVVALGRVRLGRLRRGRPPPAG